MPRRFSFRFNNITTPAATDEEWDAFVQQNFSEEALYEAIEKASPTAARDVKITSVEVRNKTVLPPLTG